MKMIIYTSKFVGKENCCVYPQRQIIESAEDLKAAAAFDHVCGAFQNNYRSVANFIESSTVVMDCDNDESENFITPEKFCEMLPNVSFAIVPSRNDGKPKGNKSPRPRFHVYFPTEKITDAEIYANLKADIYKKFPFFDSNALDAARFIFGNSAEKIIWHEGEVTIDCLFAKRTIPEGQRNNTLSRFAGRVVKRYGATEQAYKIFLDESEKCEPPLDDEEISKIWQSACRFARKIQNEDGYISPDVYNSDFNELKPPDYSDIGQAKALTKEYGDELKYTAATDYIRYDGKVWIESRQQAVGAMEEFLDLQLAESKAELNRACKALEESGISAEIIKGGSKSISKNISPSQVKLFEKYLDAAAYKAFVMKRRDMKFVLSALQAAKPMLEISPSDLDKETFLLNCPDGTYDLRQGIVGRREHKAADYITKITAVSPSDKGKDLWLAAIEKFFCGDKNLIDYVQKIAGLGIIGRVDLEALIIAYGDGRNGKSTFWNVIQKVVNNYGGGISADALTVGCKRNVKPELAETKGKRLLIAAELEEGMRLSTSIVKQLCSTDIIKGEKKYKDPFDFVPSHILVLYTNHLPRVGAMDEGIWRRLIVIPFNARIEGDADIKNYADYLFKNAGEYVLKWLIEGAEKAIAEGFKFKKPDCVERAISKYRADNDWLSHFLDECCEVAENFNEKSGRLYAEYRAYCTRTGDFARSTTEFYTALEQRGFERVKNYKGKFICGLRLIVTDFEE